ncbi:MAG: tautomerase family protein [Candidatus Sulfotelmatobacter sp.]
MPLVRISKREEYKKALGDGIHRALIEALDAPAADRFQIITEHPASGLIYDSAYLGVQRTNDIVIVQITLSTGRKLGQKRKLYQRIAEVLAEKPGVRPQDVTINPVEVAWENWLFGNGEAQYAL